MSFKCEQCGSTSAQAVNFCRKCGAPAPTATLSTAHLANATQDIGQLNTAALTTNAPTGDAAEIDPLNTWEPTKPAATEVLPNVAPHAPALATENIKQPAVAAASSGKWKLLAAAAVALLGVAVGVFFFTGRGSQPTPSSVAQMPTTTDPASTQTTPTATLPNPPSNEPVASADNGANAAALNNKSSPKPDTKTSTNKTAAMTKPAPAPVAGADGTEKSAPSASANAAAEKAEPAAQPASLIEQGNRLAGAGQFQEAIQAYEKARRANPGNGDIYYLIGSAYHRSGDLANALEAYRKCTSGNYASVAANHVKNLEKKLNKAK